DGVGYKDGLLVLHTIRNFEGIDFTKRHTDIFRMRAGIASKCVAIAQNAGAAIAVRQVGELRFGIGVITTRKSLSATVFAMAASENGRDHDAVAAGKSGHISTNLNDFAQKLMAQNITGFH